MKHGTKLVEGRSVSRRFCGIELVRDTKERRWRGNVLDLNAGSDVDGGMSGDTINTGVAVQVLVKSELEDGGTTVAISGNGVERICLFVN